MRRASSGERKGVSTDTKPDDAATAPPFQPFPCPTLARQPGLGWDATRMADLDTLVAPASAAGVSALALIRLDGPAAHAVVTQALRRATPPAMRRASVGLWHSTHGTCIDQVVVTCHAEGLVGPSCRGTTELARELPARRLERTL